MDPNDHNEYEVMDTGSMGYQPRYPLANAPGAELQQMHYKDWMDMCTYGESVALSEGLRAALFVANSIIGIMLSKIPIVGPIVSTPFQIMGAVLPFLWPPNAPEAQFSWESLMTAAEEIADKKIDAQVRANANAELEGVHNAIRLYQDAVCDWKQDPTNAQLKEQLRIQYIATNTVIFSRMPSFRVRGFEVPLLSTYVQAANLHLIHLKDGVQFGEEWGMDSATVDRFYSYLKSDIEIYTNYCIDWYNKGLSDSIESEPTWNGWNTFNNFRRDMTLMVLDLVSIWPTYDPRRYPLPTKSQLTRELYTQAIGSYKSVEPLLPPPSPFRWLREIEFFLRDSQDEVEQFAGFQQGYQYTLDTTIYRPPVVGTRTSLVDSIAMGLGSDDVVYRIKNISYNGWFPKKLDFYYTPSERVESVGEIRTDANNMIDYIGLGCRAKVTEPCDPCTTNCTIDTVNTTASCDNPNLYSHRLSSINPSAPYPGQNWMFSFCYGWTHFSVDDNNLIAADSITQIPAVKAYRIGGYGKVMKGPGYTGGDLMVFYGAGEINWRLTIPDTTKAYRVRARVATIPTSQPVDTVRYNQFEYRDIEVISPTTTVHEYSIGFDITGDDWGLLDKIEFIPIEGSVEEYEADQALEKARKAVNALFTGDAKNALQLNITDYAVDQAANLVECVSEEFHAQEKMILLDQVKFAKRLSQARNLLNYGDFESSDWSGENGWRTSPHVHVASNHPIFKGRYLHMPGATSSQFSNHIYPTYVYQKVDESKLKSYTRYMVRGFVGNSKDLELLVERYGKDVHVEMDVPNDIQYTLPRNECGGFDRCKPASYPTSTSHTCTCKDTAPMHTDCQCQDKMNRTLADTYHNESSSRVMYADGFHAHTSCGCKNSDRYQNGTRPSKSCGCKNPHVFTYHIDTGCVDQEENLGLWFALKIASENGVANIDNLEIIEAQQLTGEALARVKKREQRWKQEMTKKRLETEKAVQAAQGAIQNLFTNAQHNRLKFETLFPQIVHAEKLVQQIPYVHHPFLSGALPTVPGMNFEIIQQLLAVIGNARALYEQRNLVRNGTFSSGTGSWKVTEGVKVQPLQNTSVLVLSEWIHEASQQLHIDPNRGYVLRVTARKEGGGKGTVTMSDCADYTETLTFTSCDFNTSGSQTMTSGTLSGFVTKTLEIFPDTDRIRIDISETEGTFKIESVELICMEHMEDHMYDIAGNVVEEMRYLDSSRSMGGTLDAMCYTKIGEFGC
uniref:Crystaline entomocidal protoxin n=1 Tax=Bacillus thuringiensis TaxID=1428 RepID=K9JG52_BACTU|nr:delta-endotoxin [Bacillus thuringiensis]